MTTIDIDDEFLDHNVDKTRISATIAKLRELYPNVHESAFHKVELENPLEVTMEREQEIINTFINDVAENRFLFRYKYHVKSGYVLYSGRPNRLVNFDCPIEGHFRNAETIFQRMTSEARAHGFANKLMYFDILQIDYIENPRLANNFNQKRNHFKARGIDTQELALFHGTKEANVDSIMSNNFDPAKSHRQRYGRGIYFSEFPDICLGYGQALLLCRVLPGRVKKHSNGSHWNTLMFDSLQVANLDPSADKETIAAAAKVHVIADPDQVLPYCRIHLAQTDPLKRSPFPNATPLHTFRSLWSDVTMEAIPGAIPSAQSNSQTGAIPAAQSNSQTGAIPAAQSNSQTGAIPAAQSNSQTGAIPAAQSNSQTGAIPAAQNISTTGAVSKAQNNSISTGGIVKCTNCRTHWALGDHTICAHCQRSDSAKTGAIPKLQRTQCPGCRIHPALIGQLICADCQQLFETIMLGILKPSKMNCTLENFSCDTLNCLSKCEACQVLNIFDIGAFEGCNLEMEFRELKTKVDKARQQHITTV